MKVSVQGVMASALLVLAIAVLAPWEASAVVVLPGSGVDLTSQICASAPTGAKLCWPLSTSKYVLCSKGQGKVVACPDGKIYDYGKRTCRSPRLASPCPNYVCPTATRDFNLTAAFGKPPLSAPYGRFGQISAHNISFSTPGKYVVFCPVLGHCSSGMTFTVTVTAGGSGPKFVTVDKFEEVLKNSDLLPRRYKDIDLPVGGVLSINWDEPIHFVDVYNITSGVTLPNLPYPPQPRYKCLDWRVINNGTFIEILPGEQRLVNFQFPPVANYTWVANVTGTRWFVCPLGTHCRLGQVFKVVIRNPPPNYKPRTLPPITWTITGENYPDLYINKGDTLFFNILGVHALSLVKNMKAYSYP